MEKRLRERIACASAAALLTGVAMTGQAQAGGFSIREQSTSLQGSAFAGAGAGGDASSIFWNPASSSVLQGFNAQMSGTVLFGDSELTSTYASPQLNLLGSNTNVKSTNILGDSFIPAMYGSTEISDRLSAGISVNSPFGLTTKADNVWAGSALATTSRIRSLEFTPSLAYKLTPEFSIGAGAQVQYFRATLDSGFRDLDATGWGVGFTVGALWQPYVGTSIGIGYRSNVDVDIGGMYSSPYLASTYATAAATAAQAGNLALARLYAQAASAVLTGVEADATVTLPGQLTLSGRQALSDRFTALATVQWQEASTVNRINAKSGSCIGGVCEVLDFGYNDDWYFALGGEYLYSPTLLLRAGFSYEIAPIDNGNRNILIPDSDRYGISIGGSYKYNERVTFDLAYTHLFFDDAPVCMALGGGTSRCVSLTTTQVKLLEASADSSADLLSFGARYSTGAPVVPLEPLKK